MSPGHIAHYAQVAWHYVEPPSGMSHEGYITIMITILGIIIAVGAFVAAVLGFIGYRTIADEVAKKAEAAARSVSIELTTQRAVEAAREEARLVAGAEAASVAVKFMAANKDKWLQELVLGIQFGEAQSQAPQAASNQVEQEAVSEPYPDPAEEGQNDASTSSTAPDARPDNPPPPAEPAR
jgi:hypothetical protein